MYIMANDYHQSSGIVESISLSLSLPTALKSAPISSSKTIYNLQSAPITTSISILHWTSPSIPEVLDARFYLRSHYKLGSSIIVDTITPIQSGYTSSQPVLCLWLLQERPNSSPHQTMDWRTNTQTCKNQEILQVAVLVCRQISRKTRFCWYIPKVNI